MKYFTEEQLDNIYQFYLMPNSAEEVCKHFNISINLWKRLARDNHWILHNKQTIRQLREQTNLKMYGAKTPGENATIKEKTKQTCLNKYGTENPIGNKEIFAKSEQTCKNKYGTKTYSQTAECQAKISKTCISKYGVKAPAMNEAVQQKIKQTCLSKFGTEDVFAAKEIKDKIKDTCLKKYGVENYAQTIEFHKIAQKWYSYNNEVFDSLPELAVYIYALDHNITIERCPCKFSYIFNNKIHYYFPDFKIAGELIEIKGDHFFENNKMICPFDRSLDALYEAKHQCGLQNGVKFWTNILYNKYVEYLLKNYSKEDFLIKEEN